MTETEILEAAKEAGAEDTYYGIEMILGISFFDHEMLHKFTKIIEAKALERAANTAYEYLDDPFLSGHGYANGCSEAIRALKDES